MAHGVAHQPQLCEIIRMEEIRNGDVAAESPCDVTPERDTPEEEESARVQQWLRGFLAGYSHHSPVILCIFSLTSLIIIIALSAQLSLVSQQHDESSIILEMLRQEHGHLNSSLTFHPEETLRQTNERLEITENDLLRSQEKQKTINQDLEKTMPEKVGTGTTMIIPEDNLWNTGHILQEKINELTRCKAKLISVNAQKRIADLALSRMKTSLSKNRQKTKIKVNSQSKNETGMCSTRKRLQQVQRHLQESQRNSKKQLELLNNLEERLSELEDNLRKLEEKLRRQEEKLGIREERLGNDMRDSESHSSTICPGGWKQIDETCYYFSHENKVRYKADEDCRKKNATLAKLRENDSTLKTMVEKDGRSFWIGLRREMNLWKWSDDSLQTDFHPKTHDWCATASPELQSRPCATFLPWICQKKARSYS